MKKLFCLLLFVVVASAHATPKCVRFTERELWNMTVGELKITLKENQDIISDSTRMFASAEEHAAGKNCRIQNQRITDVLKKKLPHQAENR